MVAIQILVVEDNPTALKLVRLTLESAGYSVRSAGDGRSALAQVEKGLPAFILQDLLLPDMDGFELLHKIRCIPGAQSIPVLALSGMRAKIEEGQARGLNFAGYLLKPVEPSRLLRVVQELVPVLPKRVAPDSPLSGRLVLVVDDEPIQRKLLCIRLQEIGLNAESAKDGKEALAMMANFHPDAVISDVLMPRLDGFGLCRAIRQDPALAQVPVILVSSAYVEEQDRRLSEQVGATAFVTRSPDFTTVMTALAECWERSPVGPDAQVSERPTVEAEHADRVVHQVNRLIAINKNLTEEMTVQKVHLSILAGISAVLTRSTNIEEMLSELLVRCLEFTGFNMGEVYLVNTEGELECQARVGFPGTSEEELASFAVPVEVLYRLLTEGKPRLLQFGKSRERGGGPLPTSQERAVLVTPLSSGSKHSGLLLLGALGRYPPKGSVDFVRAVGGQIGQAIALGQSMYQLALSEQQFRNIAETAAEGIIQTDRSGNIRYVNPAGEALFDYLDGSALGLPRGSLLPSLSGQQGIHQVEALDSSGHRIPVEVSTRATVDRSGSLATTHVIRDLTERKRFEAQLLRSVNHDPITDLYNRQRWFEELERSLALSKQYGVSSALLLLDIDHFKYLNDTLGYQAGDLLLQTVAGLLQSCASDKAVLARLEGDEFAILVPGASLPTATELAQAILEALGQAQTVSKEQPVRTTASIGIAFVTEREPSAAAVFKHVELALHKAKELGRNQYAVYDPKRHRQIDLHHPLNWERRVGSALLEGRFCLWFQPIVDLRTMETYGYEALLRMVGKNGKIILPGEFIHIAEQSGLAPKIDHWVVRRAIQMMANHHRAGEHFILEVNLSAKSLTDLDLLPLIQAELDITGIPPGSLCFEITETAAITNLIQAQTFISTLRAKGCRFALDDFRIGFSSFYYLKNLPVDIIKIDGTFIRDLPRSEIDQQLVRAITTVAKGSGKRTIAECVETEETLALLRSLDVDFAQGYYLGRPAPSPTKSVHVAR